MKMNTYIFVALFIYHVEGFYKTTCYHVEAYATPCDYWYIPGHIRYRFSDSSDCSRFYACSMQNGRITARHCYCPRGKSFMQTWPDGQFIESGGSCIGDHPSSVMNCYTVKGTFLNELIFR